jgi:pimeloyl-ACP methyl ester carboxylesterase
VSFYALIHGGGGDGSVWELLRGELARRGHGSVAPDLPIEDASAGALEYAQAVLDALEGVDEPVIVVGHSLGGLTVPVVASRRPVAHMVFLGAMVPVPGRAYRDYLRERPDALTAPTPRSGYDADGRRGVRPWEDAHAAYFHDCPEDVARKVWARSRPQGVKPMTEPCPLQAWPDVPSTYVLMTEDRSVSPAWSRDVAHDRLDGRVVELPGGHSPFLSRPAELADVLCGPATAYSLPTASG